MFLVVQTGACDRTRGYTVGDRATAQEWKSGNVGGGSKAMPLSQFQTKVARLLACNRTEDSHLAGGAALHFAPNSKRYSNDLDYFHDSVERVARAYVADAKLLLESGLQVAVEIQQPGYVRVSVSAGSDSTKIEWAHDSAWRFMPPVANPIVGIQLHPIDLAVNKVLALAGRDEARDFLDVLYIHDESLPLGALCWAAVGKDPGFSPLSLLSLLKRRGKYRPEDFSRLMLTEPVDLMQLKSTWLLAVESAERFIENRSGAEPGCLYYSPRAKRFVEPGPVDDDSAPHFGRPGGVLPRLWIDDAFPSTSGSFA